MKNSGPTFVKLGQVLATRPDLLPESYILEFEKLQDNVGPVPFGEIRSLIEQELKAPLEDVFSRVRTDSMAAASIAQVHGAVLEKWGTGRGKGATTRYREGYHF